TRLLIGAGGGALGGALGGWLLSVLAQAVSGAGNSEPIQYLRTRLVVGFAIAGAGYGMIQAARECPG
ncbi:MAG: hypothetical protein ACREKN_05055, partial [Longimicrobiaceae bacterium]